MTPVMAGILPQRIGVLEARDENVRGAKSRKVARFKHDSSGRSPRCLISSSRPMRG